MAVLESAIEPRDYNKYLNTYGKEGEKDFEIYIKPYIEKKNYSLHNVSDIKEYQHISIDYIIDKSNRTELPDINTVINDDNFVKIEVKNTFTAQKTGNMAYELTTSTKLNDKNRNGYKKKKDKNGNLLEYGYDCVGWCLKTKANFIYHTFSNKETHQIEKRAWIDMSKWHEFVKNPLNQLTTNIILNERVVDILCPISLMIEQNIFKYII
jgi:hypothetical protein